MLTEFNRVPERRGDASGSAAAESLRMEKRYVIDSAIIRTVLRQTALHPFE